MAIPVPLCPIDQDQDARRQIQSALEPNETSLRWLG